MSKLDAMVGLARTAPIHPVATRRYLRELDHYVASRSLAGTTMGSYQIVREIGEGGMGIVYLGEHTILCRPAAIKVLAPQLSRNRDVVGRFFNEARAVAAIRHPGIVDIYDFGFLPDGSGYIAMEFLEGETLGGRLRREGRLTATAAVEIARQIAAALQAAHGKGITHRDLKPDNVFLVPDPDLGERVKLLDFGIAKLTAEDPGSHRTRPGAAMGTPLYMSPEQCRGDSTLDSRSDLYSLGCILYEALTGRPVFDTQSINDIIAQHLYFRPEPVRTHEPTVPESLEDLIERLLSTEPERRPATAGRVIASLEHCRTAAIQAVSDHSQPIAQLPGVTDGRSGECASTTLGGAAGAALWTGALVPDIPRPRRAVRGRSVAVLAAAAAVAVAVVIARPSQPAEPLAPPTVQPAPSPAGSPPPPSEQPAIFAPIAVPDAAPTDAAPATPRASTSIPALRRAALKPSNTPALPPQRPAAAVTDAPAVSQVSPTPPALATATSEAKSLPMPAAAPPEAMPPPVPAAEINQKTVQTPGQPTAPAKAAASKWGHLMGDRRLDGNNLLLLEQCKTAAAYGDCATAQDLAARIADRNIAMYRARVITDAAIAACLNSK